MSNNKLKNVLACLIVFGILLSGGAFAKEKTVNLDLVDANLVDVIKLFGKDANCDVVIDSAVKGSVNMKLKDVPFETALGVIVKVAGFDYRKIGNLIIVSTPQKINEISSKVSTPTGVTATQVIPLEYAAPKEVLATVNANFPGVEVTADEKLNALIVKSSAGAIKEIKNLVAKLDIASPEIDVPEIKTKMVELKYTDTDKIKPQLDSLMPGLNYSVDKRLNALIVKGTEVTFGKLENYLKQVDVPLDQVSLEVKVVALYTSGSKTVGVTNWSGNTAFGQFSTTLQEAQWSAAGYTAPPTYMDIRLGGLFPFVRSPISVFYALQAAITKGEGETIANPNITTLSGKKADISSARVYRYLVYDTRTGEYSIKETNVGVNLEITPKITKDGYIVATLKSSLIDLRSLIERQFPWTDNRAVEMTVRVKDGEPIVIGGLLKETKTKTINKIPLLGDVPIIGGFFRGNSETKRTDEIVFIVIPKIMPKN